MHRPAASSGTRLALHIRKGHIPSTDPPIRSVNASARPRGQTASRPRKSAIYQHSATVSKLVTFTQGSNSRSCKALKPMNIHGRFYRRRFNSNITISLPIGSSLLSAAFRPRKEAKNRLRQISHRAEIGPRNKPLEQTDEGLMDIRCVFVSPLSIPFFQKKKKKKIIPTRA